MFVVQGKRALGQCKYRTKIPFWKYTRHCRCGIWPHRRFHFNWGRAVSFLRWSVPLPCVSHRPMLSICIAADIHIADEALCICKSNTVHKSPLFLACCNTCAHKLHRAIYFLQYCHGIKYHVLMTLVKVELFITKEYLPPVFNKLLYPEIVCKYYASVLMNIKDTYQKFP